MKEAHLVGRVLVGVFYLLGALDHFARLTTLSRFAAARGVFAPEAAVVVSGLLLAVAGITILLGILPKVAIASLVLFFVPVTLRMHAFWTDRDPAMRAADLVNFTKNVALLGSSLMFLAIPVPWPFSLGRPQPKTTEPVHA